MNLRQGRCLCGKNSFSVQGDPMMVVNCHCLDCQKSAGAGHVTMGIFQKNTVTRSGETSSFMNLADTGAEVTREFCPNCGGRLYAGNTNMPDIVAIPLAAFDDSSSLAPGVSVYSIRLQTWDHLAEGIPAFEKLPPRPA